MRAAFIAAAAVAAFGAAAPAPYVLAQPAVRETAAPSFVVPAMGSFRGSTTIRGKAVAWSAEAGETLVKGKSGKARATMSSVAYMADDGDPATRPVAFYYNGGPGSATVALREGLAPRIIAAGEQRGTFAFVDNGESVLDAADLVFVDAPGTGYGRFASDDARGDYWGVEEDAAAFADFVETWLKGHGRTASPRFIVGESYGGVRSGFLAENLAKRGLGVNGVILVSPSTSAGGQNPIGTREAATLALPTQAAVARSHGKGAYTDLTIEEVAARASTFAFGPFSAALAKGDKLGAVERRKIAAEISRFTGIAQDKVLSDNLRIRDFGDSLLPGERLGRDDGRLHADVAEMRKLPPPYDEPGSSLYTLTYDAGAAYDSFFRFQFGYKPVGPYVRLSLDAGRNWNGKVARGAVSIPMMFKDQMAADPKLKVMMIAGYFDTTIPYQRPLADYDAAKLPKDRYRSSIYQAGHAIFYDDAARRIAGDEMRAFFTTTR